MVADVNDSPDPPVLMKCPKCNHQWYSKSKAIIVSCANCKYPFKREEGIVDG